MANLTDVEKIDICNKYLSGKYNYVMLGKEYNKHPSSINRLLKRRGIITKIDKTLSNNRKYTLNENYFDIIDNEEKAYFLGLLYSDGCNVEKYNCITIGLQEQDKYILEKLNLAIDSNKPLRHKVSSNKNWANQYTVDIYSKIMSLSLAKLGCFQRKSLTLRFPQESQVPNRLLNHFIRGYIDGDGSIVMSKKTMVYKTSIISTVYFCESLRDRIKELLNINCSIHHDKRVLDKTTRHLSIGGSKQCCSFLDWVYKDATIYLYRKYSKYIDCKSRQNAR